MPLPNQIIRLVVVLLLSGAVGSILLSVALSAHFYVTESNIAVAPFEVWVVALWICLVSAPTALAVGLPTFFLLRRFQALNSLSFSAVGVVSGALVGSSSLTFGIPFAGCVSLGLVSALIAWMLVVRSNIPLNPDAPTSGAPVS